MCLVAIALGQSERFPWVIASNRDESFDRPAAPLAWWRPEPNGPSILGGRDLSAGGAWLGLTENGRIALLTNVREPGRVDPALPSRGALVPHWLVDQRTDPASLGAITHPPRNGFNLVVADLHHLTGHWLTNRPSQHRAIGPGLHGLSNAGLDTPWPKVVSLKRQLEHALLASTTVAALVSTTFDALADARIAADHELPSTGVPLGRERQLSPAFIRISAASDSMHASYGTRCSTVVVVERLGGHRVTRVFERRFDASGQIGGQTVEQFRWV
jgi:uncharacterized protein with NRDE domain